ncbi:MAG: transposase [Nitrospira sp.]|nr:transposase [Nitrospira sp.]
MEQVPRQQYTKEFREQAVRLVLEQQVTIPEAARRLAMSGRTLERWVGRARQGQLTTLGESRRPVTELEAELSRLNGEARMECDILKATTYCEGAAARYPLMTACRVLGRRKGSTSVKTSAGECAAGSGDPGRACAHPTDLWSRTAASRTAGGRFSRRDRPHQAAAQETGAALYTGAPVHHHHGFDARPAGRGECLGPNICCHTPE